MADNPPLPLFSTLTGSNITSLSETESDTNVLDCCSGRVDDIVMEYEPWDQMSLYYYKDSLGSVVLVADQDAEIRERYEYDAYGNFRMYNGDTYGFCWSNYTLQNDPPVLFTGREYDQESGLYYYRARFYNPQIGRFMQTDPIGYFDSMNLYQYCGNNPVNWTDPSGESIIDDVIDWINRLRERVRERTDSAADSDFPSPDSNQGEVGNDSREDGEEVSEKEYPNADDDDGDGPSRSQAPFGVGMKPGKNPPKSWPNPGKGWRWNPEGYYEKGGRIRYRGPEHGGPHWDECDKNGRHNHKNVYDNPCP
jgi:RHS repeat-associated protein